MSEETAVVPTVPDGRAVKLWRLCRRYPGPALVLTLALLSLLGLMATFILYNKQLGEQLGQNERMAHRLRLTLTRQLADRIDGDLSQIAMVPHTIAATLSTRADWTEEQIASWLEEMLNRDERLFGTCVIFEPYAFDGREEVFSHFVFWGPKEKWRGRPYTDAIEEPFQDEEWYAKPKKEGRGVWTDPYLEGWHGYLMVTHAVPIYRQRRLLGISLGKQQQRFAGVATTDLASAYFEQLRHWLDHLNLGKPGYCFVLGPTGQFISHPDPDCKFPKKITDIDAYKSGKAMTTLTQRLIQHDEAGSAAAVDPYTGKPSTYYFAPIPSAQWTLVVVVEEGVR